MTDIIILILINRYIFIIQLLPNLRSDFGCVCGSVNAQNVALRKAI